MRSLGKFFFYLLVILQVLAQVCNNALHLVVPEHEVLRALRLVVKFGRQLHVLDDGELGRALQLILISHRVLHSNSPDLHQHIFPQLINLFNPVLFDTCDQVVMHCLLLCNLIIPELTISLDLGLVLNELIQITLFFLKTSNLHLHLIDLGRILFPERLDFIIYKVKREALLNKLKIVDYIAYQHPLANAPSFQSPLVSNPASLPFLL